MTLSRGLAGFDAPQQIALLDLLLTDNADAVGLAAALGKPVWWLGDPARYGDQPRHPEWQRPASIEPGPLAAALVAWAATLSGALHGELRDLAGTDTQAAMVALITACQRGQTAAARAACVQLLISHPQRPDAWRLLGVLAQQAGDLTLAGDCFERVTQLAPQYPDGWRSLGSSRALQDDPDRACEALQQCLDLAPLDGQARDQLARLHARAGRQEKAIDLYRSGLQHVPAALEWHHQLGVLLLETDQADAAEDHFNRILSSVDASHALHVPTLHQLGRSLQAQGDGDGAAACYRRVMHEQPQHLDVARALAALYRQARQAERAWALIEPLAAAHPHDPLLALEAITLRRALCDWRTEPSPARLRDLANAARAPLDTDTLLRLAEDLDDRTLEPLLTARAPLPLCNTPRQVRPRQKTRLRIGYGGSRSAVKSHGPLLSALLDAHTRQHFAVQVYQWTRASATAIADAMEAEADETIDNVISLQGRSDVELAEQLRADRIDILIDLDGFSPHARAGIWAHRPASVQLAWLNQVGTSLPPGFDARLSDRVSDGVRSTSDHATDASTHTTRAQWAERPTATLWLPGGVMGAVPFPASQLQATGLHRRKLRIALGLPDKAPVLVCLAPHQRIDPNTWALWMRLMAACPPAVLWLQEGLRSTQDRLRHAAAAAGIAHRRLVFADVSKAAACCPAGQVISAADLCLQTTLQMPDTDGNDPISNALCAAVPVLCVAGHGHASRRSAAMLHAAGQARGVSTDWVALETLARHLLCTPRELLAWRNELIQAHHQAPLFAVTQLARQLETAWQSHWQACVKRFTPSTAMDPVFSG